MDDFELEQYLFDKSKRMGRPVRAVLELTPVCNFNCKFCYIRHSHKDVMVAGGTRNLAFWKDLISQMEKMGVLIVTLIGGEPLIFDGFGEVYRELIDKGFLVNVTTNGTMIDDEIIQLFKEKPPRYVTVSLYGASNESYKRVTGNSKGFDMAIAGIERMISAGIPVKLNYIVSSDNKEDLDGVFKIKEKYGLPLLADAYCFPACRKPTSSEQNRLSAKECAEYHMTIKKLERNEQRYYNYCRYLARGDYQRIDGYHDEKVHCYAGTAVFWINWRGNMMPCGFLENLSVSLEKNLEVAWGELKEKVSTIRTSKKCSKCDQREICHVCAASMYWETGSFEETPEYLCEMTDEMIRIAKNIQ